MAVDVEQAIRTVGFEQYTQESANCIKPEDIILGSEYVARFVLSPKVDGRISEARFNKEQIITFAADIIVKANQVTPIPPKAKRWYTVLSSPDICDFDLSVTPFETDDETVGEPQELKMSQEGIIYSQGDIHVFPPFLVKRYHAELGYFPGDEEPDHADFKESVSPVFDWDSNFALVR